MMKKLFCILTVILCVMLVQASVMAEENAAVYLKKRRQSEARAPENTRHKRTPDHIQSNKRR